MPTDEYSDDCPGCRPCLVDMTSGQPLSEDAPGVKALNAAWAKTSKETRQAWHAVTCKNSRDPEHLALCRAFVGGIWGAFPPP